jgi:hypothetical protein
VSEASELQAADGDFIGHTTNGPDPKALLGRRPHGSAAGSVSIANASIIVEPRNLRAWAIAQLLNINWGNVALMITVLLAISSMKDLLRQSQEQFVHWSRKHVV